MILHYFKVAVRSQMKFKMQNIIAILGLAMSLFCFSVCLYCSRYIFSTDDCFDNKDRIVEINLYDDAGFFGCPGKLAKFLRDQNLSSDAFCNVTFPDERHYNVEVSDEKMLPYILMFAETDSLYYKVFTPQIVCGNWNQAASNPNSVILFESTAMRIFGSAEKAIGSRMILTKSLWTSPRTTPSEGGINYTIQAVVKDLPLNNSINFLRHTDALVINDTEGLENAVNTGITGAYTFGLPATDKDASMLIDEINGKNLVYHIFNDDKKIRADRFGTYLWNSGPASYFAKITLVAGILVLIVGLINFLHFIIGSFFIRVRECNIRRVNGAGFKDLFMMFFVQISISILLSVFFTFLIIELLSPFLRLTIIRFSIIIDPHLLMWHTFTYLMGLMALCVVISLFVIIKVRSSYVKHTSSHASGRYGSHRLRNISLGIQLFVGFIFLSFASALYLQSAKTGNRVFSTLSISEKERILSIPFDYSFMDNNTKKALVEELRKCPGVEDIIVSEDNYVGGIPMTAVYLTENRDKFLAVNVLDVLPEFFRFMNVEMISGKVLHTKNEMIIDDILAKRIEKNIQPGDILYDYQKGYTLAGISSSFLTSNYSGDERGFMFILSESISNIEHCYVKSFDGKVEETRASIISVMRKALPENVDVNITTMMDDIREQYALEFKLRSIVLFMAVVAIVISLLGIYSAITLDTEYRRKEMAIRKINGAGVRQIVMLFARLYIVLILSTAVVAFPVIEILTDMFGSLYISFIDTGFLFYGSITLCVVLLVTLAVYVRIRNIAHINPSEIIKSE